MSNPGEAVSNDYEDALSKSHDSQEWHRDGSVGHPAGEAPTDGRGGGEGAGEPGDDDDSQPGAGLGGVSYRSPHRADPREGRWDDGVHANGVGARSPPREARGWRPIGGPCGDGGDEPDPDVSPGGFLCRARAYRAEELRYRRDSSPSEGEGDGPGRDGWAGGLSERPPDVDKPRINLSLLEQAMVLQSEQRQVLHHAYKEMDLFLLEQMSNERRQHQHHRLQDMEVRSGYNGCKGTSPRALLIQREPSNTHT